eukprot:768822-Hanusia_phi.AAC.5
MEEGGEKVGLRRAPPLPTGSDPRTKTLRSAPGVTESRARQAGERKQEGTGGKEVKRVAAGQNEIAR